MDAAFHTFPTCCTMGGTLWICGAAVLFLSLSTTRAWPDTRQKSRFNDGHPGLAIDGLNDTCATTGRDMHPWWEVQLDPALNHTVTSITIQGAAGLTWAPASRLLVRVGFTAPDLEGDTLPATPATLCAVWDGPLHAINDTIACKEPMRGSRVMIEAEGNHIPLELCDVVLNA